MTDFLDILDSYSYPSPDVNTKPTSGKREGTVDMCRSGITNLQNLQKTANLLYERFKLSVTKSKKEVKDSMNPLLPEASNFVLSRISAGENTARRMMTEIQKVLDPSRPNYIKMAYTKLFSIDFATLNQSFSEFETGLLEIETKAKKIKIDNTPEIQEVTVSNNTDTQVIDADDRSFIKSMYTIKMYMIFPDNDQVRFENYITDFVYSINYDENVMPIYTVKMKIPPALMVKVKNYFEEIKWFLTVEMFEKSALKSQNDFIIKEVIKDNVELTAIDPQYYPSQDNVGKAESVQPIYPIKIDFVSTREIQLNTVVQAQTFTNCTIFEVVNALCQQSRSYFKDKGKDTKYQMSYSISPPDNKKKYRNIFVKPGSLSETLYSLQEQYGIYRTGMKVSFDTSHTVKRQDKYITIANIAITNRDGVAPPEGAIHNVVCEALQASDTNTIGYESGYLIDKDTNTLVLRSFENYKIFKNNSNRLIKGDSVRVMCSSNKDNFISACDSTLGEVGTQKFYWSKYDNPYNLSQLQDTIREGNQTVEITARDFNIFALNNNLNYNIKFFSKDDETCSGRYRLKGLTYYFNFPQAGPKDRVETNATLFFTNLPILRENGSNVPRKTYGEKVASGANKDQSSSANLPDSKPASGGGFSSDTASVPAPPFTTKFRNFVDFNGTKVPDKLPEDYKMSSQIKFKDLYDCESGRDMYKVNGLTSNFNIFINAQRFSTEVIDPIFNKFGKPSSGKLIEFYKYNLDTNDAASSQHVIALAADFVLGSQSGDEMAKKLKDLITVGDCDQYIMYGDGSKWTHVHVGKQQNGTNRGQVILSPTGIDGDTIIVKSSEYYKLADPNMIKYANFRKFF